MNLHNHSSKDEGLQPTFAGTPQLPKQEIWQFSDYVMIKEIKVPGKTDFQRKHPTKPLDQKLALTVIYGFALLNSAMPHGLICSKDAENAHHKAKHPVSKFWNPCWSEAWPFAASPKKSLDISLMFQALQEVSSCLRLCRRAPSQWSQSR